MPRRSKYRIVQIKHGELTINKGTGCIFCSIAKLREGRIGWSAEELNDAGLRLIETGADPIIAAQLRWAR